MGGIQLETFIIANASRYLLEKKVRNLIFSKLSIIIQVDKKKKKTNNQIQSVLYYFYRWSHCMSTLDNYATKTNQYYYFYSKAVERGIEVLKLFFYRILRVRYPRHCKFYFCFNFISIIIIHLFKKRVRIFSDVLIHNKHKIYRL